MVHAMWEDDFKEGAKAWLHVGGSTTQGGNCHEVTVKAHDKSGISVKRSAWTTGDFHLYAGDSLVASDCCLWYNAQIKTAKHSVTRTSPFLA